MNEATPAYGLWGLVLINSVIFIMFAFTFFKPRTSRDWRSFGAFSAFLVALFTEMYGFPLTLYFLSGWLQSRYPNVDWLSHDAGHLLEMLLGWKANPHFGPFHILSNVLVVVGFLVISAAWRVLYDAQRKGGLATTGPYAYVRHPQYVGFILVMFGFLLQWPTLLTLAMFPVLVWMYVRLARTEEQEVRSTFGDAYERYAARTPAWSPASPRRRRRSLDGRKPRHPLVAITSHQGKRHDFHDLQGRGSRRQGRCSVARICSFGLCRPSRRADHCRRPALVGALVGAYAASPDRRRGYAPRVMGRRYRARLRRAAGPRGSRAATLLQRCRALADRDPVGLVAAVRSGLRGDRLDARKQ
jgi:protein-S-isoprenylcysteine O-methyltransferase Ste14